MKLLISWLVLAAAFQTPSSPVRTVGKGAMSEIDAPRQEIARTPAEWSALWKAHGSNEPQPAVDFSREMVAAVFLGSRPTAGYGVEIVRSVASPETLIVEYIESGPPRGALTAQVLTSPFHLVAIPKRDGNVTFRKVDK